MPDQLCYAHALRELQGVADTADPDSDWCWATQARDALFAMERLTELPNGEDDGIHIPPW